MGIKKTKDPLAEYMIQAIAEQSAKESLVLLKYICPIYRVGKREIPEQFGTGTLLNIKNHYFLITAAHVLDDNDNSTLYVPGKRDLALLAGPSFRSSRRADRKADRTDVGVIEIKSPLLDEMSKESFMPISMLDVNDTGTPGGVYIAMGYPASKNKYVDTAKRTFKRHPIAYSANILPGKALAGIGVSPASHILIEFKKEHSRDTTGKEVVAPDPYGMSGGPLWRFETFTRKHIASSLVGIVIEWRKEVKGILAFRIPILLAGILHAYPHLADYIPKTRTVNVKVTEEKTGEE